MYKNLLTHSTSKQIIETLGFKVFESKSFDNNYYFIPVFKKGDEEQSFIVQVIFGDDNLNVLIVPHMDMKKRSIYSAFSLLSQKEQDKNALMVKNFYDDYLKTISILGEEIKSTIQQNCKEYEDFRLRSLFKNKLNIKISINWSHKPEEYILK